MAVVVVVVGLVATVVDKAVVAVIVARKGAWIAAVVGNCYYSSY